MLDSEIISFYRPMVDFIADIIGDECEVVLHDLSIPDKSVIAIRNGHLSGRTIGSPITDFTLKILSENRKGTVPNYLVNYIAVASSGCKFRAATYFIKNMEQKVVGMLCVNISIDLFERFNDFLNAFTKMLPVNQQETADIQEEDEIYSNDLPIEHFQGSVGTIIEQSVRKAIIKIHAQPERMNTEERQEFIKMLYNDGIFMLKGGVPEVAKILCVSEPSIYRYLKNIK